MRVSIYAVALPILAAVALAQDTPPAQQKPPDTPQANSSTQGQADRSADQKSDKSSSKDSTAGQKSDMQATDKAGAQGSDRLPEMKTQSYSGTLMDASCAGSGSTATPATASATDTPTASSSSADRATGSTGGQSCSVSASTTQFAIKTKDGTTMRFDDVGNARTQEALKNRKKWSESATASKPIHVKASGVLNGDKLTVMSIN